MLGVYKILFLLQTESKMNLLKDINSLLANYIGMDLPYYKYYNQLLVPSKSMHQWQSYMIYNLK